MKILKSVLYENGNLSLIRSLAVAGFLAFLAGHGGKGFIVAPSHAFATMTGGGGLATQLGNKFINSRYNSPDGVPPAIKKETTP